MTPEEMESLLKKTEAYRDELSLAEIHPTRAGMNALGVQVQIAFEATAALAKALREAITGQEAG